MKDFRSLKLLDRFRFVFEKFGVDYKIMRKILQMKLIMDERRVPTIMANHKKNDKDKNFFIRSLLSYFLVGLVAMAIIILPMSIFAKMSFCFGMMMFMIMTTMIADFSSVLLDIKDKNILMCKPINSKTINMAKIIHIFIYISIITIVIAGPSLIVGTIKYGFIFFLIFFFDLFLSSAFIIFLTSIIYCLVLNFFDGEKLKDIINYVQIILSIVLLIGYQMIGRMFDIFKYDVAFTPSWWAYLIPPVWFAAPFQIFIEKGTGIQYISLSLLNILVPIIALVIHIKFIIPYFEKNLSKLNNNSAKRGGIIDVRSKVARIISQIFCFDRMESIFFIFTQKMISNERKLKLRIYPNLAFASMMPLIIIFRSFGGNKAIPQVIGELSDSKAYLSIYITVLILSLLIVMIKTSEKYKGAWIYRVLPIEEPTPIYRGAFKGFLIKYVFPVYLIPSLIFLMICGLDILIDMVLILLNLILLCLIIFKTSSKELPFSMDFNHVQNSNIMALILSLIFCGISAGLHVFLKATEYGLAAYCAVVALVIMFLWKKGIKHEWKDLI